MRETRNKLEQHRFLSGWKEIASYLGMGVRTVQRYERELGLPIRRPAGKPRGSVMATKVELDAWVEASSIREAFHLSRFASSPSAVAWTEMKKGMEEMQRLRNQTMALRAEVRASVEMLRDGVRDLWGGVNEKWRRGGEEISSNPGEKSWVHRGFRSHVKQ